MLIKPIRLLVLASIAICSQRAAADETVPADDAGLQKPWSLEITLDYPSQYFFRGYNLNPGADVILQPGAELSYTLIDRETITVTGYVGVWANVADADGPHSPRNF